MNPMTSRAARPSIYVSAVFVCSLFLTVAGAGGARAHCDSLDGPIVPEAQAALETGDVAPVLKWVRADDEGEIREAFAQARALRGRDEDVRRLADRHFLETLVRVHRQGEGAPYTGLKPAGHIAPAFVAADAALTAGNVDAVADEVAAAAGAAIRAKFAEASERLRHAEHNVEAGREYVEAYVQYIHLVEGLHGYLAAAGAHGAAPACGGHAD